MRSARRRLGGMESQSERSKGTWMGRMGTWEGRVLCISCFACVRDRRGSASSTFVGRIGVTRSGSASRPGRKSTASFYR